MDAAVTSGIASVVAPGGRLDLVLAPAGRDHLDGVPTAPADVTAAARAAFEEVGLVFTGAVPMTADEIRSLGSSWAGRLLREGRERRAIRIAFTSP
jgi:hypothetical protein